MKRRRTSTGGYTLVELMLVVGLIGVVAGISGANFQGMFRKSHFREFTQATRSALMLGRAEAIRKARTVRCVLGPDLVVVFVDMNGDGEIDEGDDIVYSYPEGEGSSQINPANPSSTIREGMGFESEQALYVIFNSQGYSVDTSYEFRGVTFNVIDTPGGGNKTFEVSVAGSVRVVE